MKNMVKWEKGDRVLFDDRSGTVGNMAEPIAVNILPDGAQSWALRWWVRWDDAEAMGRVWGSDLVPAES